MPTLRHLTTMMTGGFRDVSTNRVYREEELCDEVEGHLLDQPIVLERQDRGVYAIRLRDGGQHVFDLYSRRSSTRAMADHPAP